MSSGGFEPGDTHILNSPDSIYYMGVTFLLHEELHVPDHRQYPSAPRSEFRSTYPIEVAMSMILGVHSSLVAES
jgi:hypothetical protein